MSDKVIWKFPLPIKENFELELPVRFKVIRVGEQRGKPMLWAIVDPDARTIAVRFYCCGTGHVIRDDGGASLEGIARKHIDSVDVGDYVWHYFMELTP